MRALAGSAAIRGMVRIAIRARELLGERRGSVAVEYGVIAGLVATAIVVSLGTISGPLGELIADLTAS